MPMGLGYMQPLQRQHQGPHWVFAATCQLLRQTVGAWCLFVCPHPTPHAAEEPHSQTLQVHRLELTGLITMDE